MSERPVLVVGGDGLIGRALADRLRQMGRRVLTTTRRGGAGSTLFLDLETDVSGWKPPEPFEVAFLTAAIGSHAACRENPAGTARVNVDAPVALARTLVNSGAFVVFLSTSAVFDGASGRVPADLAPSPHRESGRQKARVEREVLGAGEQAAVVRFTKVLGPDQAPFNQWARDLTEGRVVRPARDIVMSPVPLAFAVEALVRLADLRRRGILQVSADHDISYEEAARHLAARLGAKSELLRPVTARELGVDPADAPAYTTLDTQALREELRLNPPDPMAAVESAAGLGWVVN